MILMRFIYIYKLYYFDSIIFFIHFIKLLVNGITSIDINININRKYYS